MDDLVYISSDPNPAFICYSHISGLPRTPTARRNYGDTALVQQAAPISQNSPTPSPVWTNLHCCETPPSNWAPLVSFSRSWSTHPTKSRGLRSSSTIASLLRSVSCTFAQPYSHQEHLRLPETSHPLSELEFLFAQVISTRLLLYTDPWLTPQCILSRSGLISWTLAKAPRDCFIGGLTENDAEPFCAHTVYADHAR